MNPETEIGFVWGSLGITQDVFLGLEWFSVVCGGESWGDAWGQRHQEEVPREGRHQEGGVQVGSPPRTPG